MTKIPCEVIQDLLPLYIDGLTSETTDKVIAEHLEECEACRNLYRQMKEPEKPAVPDQPEIDYLKTIRKRSRRRVLQAVAGVLLAMLAVLGWRVFLHGSQPSGSQFAAEAAVDGTRVSVQGQVTDSLHTVSDVSFTEENGTVTVTVSTVLPSFVHSSGSFQEEYTASQPVHTVILNGQVLLQDGITISRECNEIMATAHPYVGDMSANTRSATAVGISRRFGPYTNSLQTEAEPYSWTITLEEPLKDRLYQEMEMDRCGAVLIAMTENLSEVRFAYRADGEDCLRTITEQQADEKAGFPVKQAAGSYALLQQLLN